MESERTRRWYESRTLHHSDFPPERLASERTRSVTACLPARNEARTVGPIVADLAELRELGAIDEVLVVAPALNSKAKFLTSDSDEAIARAEQVQEETVERLDEEGIDAAGDIGESDPLLALQDALQTYPADEIVLCVHGESGRNWQEDGLLEEARERFGKPVKQLVVE